LRFLAPRAIPGVELVDAESYRRTIFLNGKAGFFEVSRDENGLALSARIQFVDSRCLFLIVEKIRRKFDLNADWQMIASRLRADEALKTRLDASPGLRVAGCWDGFELAIKAILGQHLTVEQAATLTGELVTRYGKPFYEARGLTHLFPPAEVLAQANLIRVGMSSARAESIQSLARAVCEGKISFEGIVDTDKFLTQLCEVPGIETWTARYVAMRALGEPDAWPGNDPGLVKALGLRSAQELEERSQKWRPWRAYAAMYLWNVRERLKGREKKVVSTGKRKNSVNWPRKPLRIAV